MQNFWITWASVHKILLEAERNNEVYEEKLKTYRKLTKQ